MSLSLLSTSSYGLHAAFNPIPVYLERRDIAYTAISDMAGDLAFTVGTDLDLTRGEMIYIKSVTGADWTGWHEVWACSSTKVVTTTLYVAGISTGYLSSDELYSNYYAIVQVRNYRTNEQLVELVYSIGDNHQAYINLSGVVRVLLGKDNNYGYHTGVSPPVVSGNVAEEDENLMCRFAFRWKEHYLGADDDSPPPSWSVWKDGFAVNSAMQMGENSNLITWKASSGRGRFLTEFETITVFKGYPNCVTFIWLDYAIASADYTLVRYQTFVAGITSRLTREELIPYAGLPDNAVRVTIDDQSANEQSGDIKIEYYDNTDSPPNYITAIESIPLIYDDGKCYDNPVYLCWLNIYGGFSYWLFHTTQQIKHEVFGVSETLKAVEDWENERTQEDVFEVSARDKYVVGAQNITSDQLVGIKNMLHSPRVMLLLNPDGFAAGDAPDWLTVRIQSNTFLLGSTGDSRFKVEFTLKHPRINIQQT